MQAEPIVSEKTCSKCKVSTPLSDFWHDKTRKDGLFPQCKNCLRAYRAAHSDQQKATMLAWRETHKDEEAEYRRQYRATNKEAIKQRRKAAYDANPEKYRAQTKAYADANREKYRDSNRSYFQSPKGHETLRRNARKRRVPKNSSTLTLTTADLVSRQGGKCYYCDKAFTKRRKAELEHVIPLSRGGLNADDNVVAACVSCNRTKSAKAPDDYAREIGRLLL